MYCYPVLLGLISMYHSSDSTVQLYVKSCAELEFLNNLCGLGTEQE
jgi:hypothetical protein